MNNQMKKNKYKGEKMSLRKITTLLLLVAFAFTSMPAQAASVISTGTTPSVIGDAGKAVTKYVEVKNEEAIKSLKAKGVTLHDLSKADRLTFRQAAQKAWGEWSKKHLKLKC